MTEPTQDTENYTDTEVLNNLINKAALIDEEINGLEQLVKSKKEFRIELGRKHIPDAMRNLQMSAFTSTNGYEVKIKETHFGRIEDAVLANEWLKESGNQDIIKRQIVSKVNIDDNSLLAQLQEFLSANDIEHEIKEAVNHQTLNKFVRECIEENIELPKSIKVTTINEAKIKHVQS